MEPGRAVHSTGHNHGVGEQSTGLRDLSSNLIQKGRLVVNSEVATCHVAQCQFNENMDCQAPNGVEVEVLQEQADCNTFEPTR